MGKVAHPLYLVYKASLLKRPPPPPPSPPPSPQVEIRNMQESDEERGPGDIELPPPNTEELGHMDEDNNNNYTEGEDNVEMEAGDIELPSPDLEELASMLDGDSPPNTEELGVM